VAVPAPLSVAAPPPTIAVAPTIAAAEAELDRGGIRRAVTEQFVPKARDCYNALLGRDPAAQGRVTLHFAVVRDGERGVVEDCAVHEAGTDMADTLFRGCLVDGMRTVVFEAPTGEGRVTIEYPFVFKTGANGEALVSQ
ncbi:MAG: AgmX/PglI C-terminal domain-containing protein, partial [Deltaproteobacteria bacterium]|nr:AgmX/PglI C-terminal domain-containing protein [Nannocystaceae bacterium]